MNPLSSLSLAMPPEIGSRMPALPEVKTDQIPTVELEGLKGSTPSGIVGRADGSFGRVLGEFVQDVNSRQAAAGDAVNNLLSGNGVSLHQAMIAMEEASVSFQLMVEVRNKLLESYQELMRMQI